MNTQLESKKDKNLKSFSAYFVGFCLCILLTLLSFYIAAYHKVPANDMMLTLMVLAVIQLVVQVIFFLRLNATEEGRWSLMPFLFTVLIVLVLVFGSLWIMINLNYNMVH